MRSCEYTKVEGSRKTKIVCLGDVEFLSSSKRIIPHHDRHIFATSVFVRITFRDQKNGDKMDSRTQEKTGDPVLCPVRRWLRIVQNLLLDRNSTTDSPVSIFFNPASHKASPITGQALLLFLRKTADDLGPDHLGYKGSDIGTHSIRSGAAMALYLADQNVVKIMLLGRWKSDAFLAYIRPQVIELSTDLSQIMITTSHFNHTPRRPLSTTQPDSNLLSLPFLGSNSSALFTKFHLRH
jgi:hypothetical protein